MYLPCFVVLIRCLLPAHPCSSRPRVTLSNDVRIKDGGSGKDDRHKYDDEAGDSDDGPNPEDSDFEDEEVDEDTAFDSADEAR